MTKVLVTESHLQDIAFSIRAKTGGEAGLKPGQMAAAIQSIIVRPAPAGTLEIAQNGTFDVSGYAGAAVSVPNTYTAEDEGKIVKSGALVPLSLQSVTVTRNGTVTPDTGYDGLSSVTVDVDDGSARKQLFDPVINRALASLNSGLNCYGAFRAYVVGSSSYPYSIGSMSVDGVSTPTLMRSTGYYNGYVAFAEPIPKNAQTIKITLQYGVQSSNYGRQGRLYLASTINTTSGDNLIKTVHFVNSGMSVADINAQQGVTINSTDNKSLGLQTVEIDVSDVDVDAYVTLYDTNCKLSLVALWCE